MFAGSFNLVLLLLLVCVCIPAWIKRWRNNTRARDLVNHIGLNIENGPDNRRLIEPVDNVEDDEE